MSTTALMSFAEFEQLPDFEGRRELIEGELVEMPPPRLTHDEIAKRIFRLLGTVLDDTRVWIATGYQMGTKSWLVPDVSATWPNQERRNDYFQAAPMVAVEILSPTNTAAKIDHKLRLYLRDGGGAVWVFNHETRDMTVWVMEEGSIRATVLTDEYSCPLTNVRVNVPDILAAASE